MPRGSFTQTQPQSEQRTAFAIAGSPARFACATLTRACTGLAPLQNREGQRLLRGAANISFSNLRSSLRAQWQRHPSVPGI